MENTTMEARSEVRKSTRHDVGVYVHPGVKLVVAAEHDDAAEVLTM